MNKNIGSIDKAVRLIIGFVLLGLYFFGPQTPLGLIGIIPIMTSIIGICPAYIPFKISTIKKNK